MVKDISGDELAEMFRAQAGLVTALIAHDDEAVKAQLRMIIEDQGALAEGDARVLVWRLAKQAEVGARMTWHAIKSLAPRLGLTEAETNRVLAETYAERRLD